MGSIWGFLLQTLSVSVVAVLILVLKWIMKDKLSPRWQYGVWIVLAIRAIIPVKTSRSLIFYVPLGVEMLKGWAADKDMSGKVLWYVYIAGALVCLLWYFVSYIRLRGALLKGEMESDNRFVADIRAKVDVLCEKFGIKRCKVVSVEGIDSAFICGVFDPVMAVPAGKAVDEKVLVHELMHLKYKDTLQGIGWCMLRAIHWCNPFMHYVFDRIGNDMESLCDQRVLEQLEGEALREYGKILLDMANDKYARTPGTSSISNGGKNISRRIESIVRFRKYPKGMGLVSVCIVLVLMVPCLMGTGSSYAESLLMPMDERDLSRSMAMARVTRCETMAGAIDTYAKGLMLGNGVYIAIASPEESLDELEEKLIAENVPHQMAAAYDFGDEYGVIERHFGYDIFNISDNGDGSYDAQLGFYVVGWSDLGSEAEPVLYHLGGSGDGEGFDPRWQKIEECENEYTDEFVIIVPIRVFKDTDKARRNAFNGWVVEESGEPVICGCDIGLWDNSFTSFPMEHDFGRELIYNGTPLPWRNVISEAGENGKLNIGVKSQYHIDNYVKAENAVSDLFFAGSFDTTLKPAAVFSGYTEYTYGSYDFGDAYQGADEEPMSTATVRMIVADGPDAQKIEFCEESDDPGSSAGGASDQVWANQWADENWNGNVLTSMYYQDTYTRTGMASYNNSYKIEVLWDGEAIEEYLFEEVG